jgi:hypothetical protein
MPGGYTQSIFATTLFLPVRRSRGRFRVFINKTKPQMAKAAAAVNEVDSLRLHDKDTGSADVRIASPHRTDHLAQPSISNPIQRTTPRAVDSSSSSQRAAACWITSSARLQAATRRSSRNSTFASNANPSPKAPFYGAFPKTVRQPLADRTLTYTYHVPYHNGPSGLITIIFESGKLAKLADGAVTVRCGDTIVIVTAVSATTIKEGQDFFLSPSNTKKKPPQLENSPVAISNAKAAPPRRKFSGPHD